MNKSLIALAAGALAGACWQGLGHYLLHAPRIVIKAPYTYVWGCAGILFGAFVKDELSDRLTTADLLAIMAASGAATFAAYAIDARIDGHHKHLEKVYEGEYCA